MADDEFSRQLSALERLAAPPRQIKKKRHHNPASFSLSSPLSSNSNSPSHSSSSTLSSSSASTSPSLSRNDDDDDEDNEDDEDDTLAHRTHRAHRAHRARAKRVRKLSMSVDAAAFGAFGPEGEPLPVSKRPKGFKSILKNRRKLSVDGIGDDFQMPEPLILNEYWALFPVPQKALFRDLLSLAPAEPVSVPSRPEVSNAQLWQLQDFEQQFSAVQKERAALLGRINALEKDGTGGLSGSGDHIVELKAQVAELSNQLELMEAENQERALAHARAVYEWSLKRDELEADAKARLKTENNRKVEVLTHLANGLKSQVKYMNIVQNSALDIEMPKAIESVGGVNGEIPEITAETPVQDVGRITELNTRVREVLDKVKSSSIIKAKISSNQTLIKNFMDPLRAHLPHSKGKYEKSGEFTKEKRAAKVATARPYNKTGKHIHDYQNPRDKKQRDKQIQERAKKLGISVEEFRQCVMGK